MNRPTRYPQEVRERAVRMVFEHRDEHRSQWATICSIAEKFGMSAETLRSWVRRAEIDGGIRPGLTTEERERLKARAREQGAAAGQRDPQERVGFLRGGARPPTQAMISYIDEKKEGFGVEPICAPSADRPVHLLRGQAATALGQGPSGMRSSRWRFAGSTETTSASTAT